MAIPRAHRAVAVAATLLALTVVPVAAQSPSAGPGGLAGTSWAVTAVGETPGTGATLVFTDDMVGGSAGCNRYRAAYESGAGTLTIGPAATTLMACDPAIMTFEQSFLGALGNVAGYTVADGTLSLTDASGTEVLAFTAQSPVSLEGEWEITGYLIGSGETAAVTSPIVGSTATLTFGPDGIVSGTAGCNQFSGGYGVEGANITIGPLMSTMMACEDALMTQESAVMLALEDAATWSVTGPTAELRGEADTIQVTLSSLTPTTTGG